MNESTEYIYSFTPWPDQERDTPIEVFDLFRELTCRVQFQFSEYKFNEFEKALVKAGITLREVEQAPVSIPKSTPVT